MILGNMRYLNSALAIGLLSATSIAQEVVTVSIPTCLRGAGVTTFLPGAGGTGGAGGATGARGTDPETLIIAVTETNSLGSVFPESLTEVVTSGVTLV
jgi:hypothetical protein